MEDRLEAARDVVRQLITGDEWEAALDPDIPEHLGELIREVLAAYRRGDIEWLLDHAAPDVVIAQVPEIPDARTYRGHEGFVDSLLDWPRQWENFRIEPRRIFAAGDDWLIVDMIHRGRSRSVDLEVEAQIVFAMRWRDERLTNWDMFLTVEEALSRAAERGADRDDDRAAESHRRERA